MLARFFYGTTRDPASYHRAETISWQGDAYFIASVSVFLTYGILLIQSRTPSWLGTPALGEGVVPL